MIPSLARRPFLLGSVIVAAVSPLHAATIANFSFETNVNPNVDGRFSFGESRDFGPNGDVDTAETGDENNISSWTTVTTENTSLDSVELAVGFFNIAPSAGSQVLGLVSGASTKQFTSVAWSSLTAGDQITMTVAIGDRNSVGIPYWADESFFSIIDGSTSGTLAAGTLRSNSVANSGLLTTPFTSGGIDGGTMQDRSLTYTVLAGDLARSGNVGVLLAAFGTTQSGNGLDTNQHQAFFDNVRLDIIPEPSAALLSSLGMLALLRRRRN